MKPLGQVKLTTQKFYRINGGSTQLRGVTPDIILPDNYSFIPLGEKEQEYPLPWTEKWISGGNVQVAPQETEISSYIVGGVKQDVDKNTLSGLSL